MSQSPAPRLVSLAGITGKPAPTSSAALDLLLERKSSTPAVRKRFYINVNFLALSSVITVRVYIFDQDREVILDSAPVVCSEQEGKAFAKSLERAMAYPRDAHNNPLVGEALEKFDPFELLVSEKFAHLNFAPTNRPIKPRNGPQGQDATATRGRGLLDAPPAVDLAELSA